jgi:hypothetical protein
MKIRGSRNMPSPADLDPFDMTQILLNIILLDVAREPLNFRHRLLQALSGPDLTAVSSDVHAWNKVDSAS